MVNQALAIQTTWQDMIQQADVLVKSKFLPKAIQTKEQALAVMLKGQELDIPPWSALTGIHIIQGVPTVSPQLMLALIRRSGQLENIDIQGDERSCTVMMKRRGNNPHVETFTWQDAEKMQTKEDGQMIALTKKFNWKTMPAVMLKWRAVAACARIVFPDVIAGLYTTEEINPDVTMDSEGGITIDVPYTIQTQTNAETGEIIEPEEIPFEDESLSTEAIIAAYRDLNPDIEEQDYWYDASLSSETLEELLLDHLVDKDIVVALDTAEVIKTEKGLFYALDFRFNRSKKVILKLPVEKSDKAGKRVVFEDMLATLQKTPTGNYAATPLEQF